MGKSSNNVSNNVSNSTSVSTPPPPAPLQRTRLKSAAAAFVPRSDLTAHTEAPLFVPQCMDPSMPVATMPPTPSEGKDCLMSVIGGTLGGDLWDLMMMDCQSITGEVYTTVDIVIPALSASNCHLVASDDAELVAAAQQAQHCQATQSLLQSFATLNPKVTVMPSQEGTSQLAVTYCGVDRNMLCRDFSNFGSCSHGHKCHWAHAFVETFLINLVLMPLTQFSASDAAQQAPCLSMPAKETKQERWTPMRPPQLANDGIVAAPPKTCALPADPEDTSQSDHVVKESSFDSMKADASKTPSRRRMLSRQNWADIDDDEN